MADRTAWRLCNQSGIMSAIVKTRKRRGKKPGPPVCDDLVERNFTATGANELWLVDITEHPTTVVSSGRCNVEPQFGNRRQLGSGLACPLRTRRRFAG
jgi:transposase InsO family protein